MLVQYAPPPLDTRLLVAQIHDMFPSHKHTPPTRELTKQLVEAYANWWRMMLTFPKYIIVAPAHIMFVRYVHSREVERYMSDCSDYLGTILLRDKYWEGEINIQGTIHTAAAVRQLFDEPAHLPWQPILHAANRLQSARNVVLM